MSRSSKRAGRRVMDVVEAPMVQRHQRYVSNGSPAARDLTSIEVVGTWSHGQRQHVSVLLPTEIVLGLVSDLVAAVAPDVDQPKVAGVAPVPARPGAGPVEERTAVPVGSSLTGPSPAPPRRARDPHPLVAALEQRAARQFAGNERAREAWLRPHLHRHHVEELDQLPTDVLASLFNGLAAHQQK